MEAPSSWIGHGGEAPPATPNSKVTERDISAGANTSFDLGTSSAIYRHSGTGPDLKP